MVGAGADVLEGGSWCNTCRQVPVYALEFGIYIYTKSGDKRSLFFLIPKALLQAVCIYKHQKPSLDDPLGGHGTG